MRKVVVTGIGVVCATGHSAPAFTDALREGRSGTARLTHFDPDWFQTQVGAEVRDVSFDLLMPSSEQRHVDRQSLLALMAAEEAVTTAGFSAEADPDRCAVILGTGMGPSETIEEAMHEVMREHKKPRPTSIPKMMYNAAVGHLSIRHGCQGPSQLIVTACSASAHALGQAALLIRGGFADAALAGGTESFPSYSLFAAWDTLRVMSRANDRPEAACRPFSADREGFAMGEGAAVLALEAEDRARERGAPVLGELLGVGMSSDAAHITRPQLHGFVAALRAALHDAGLNPEDVHYVNAHGTGTTANDPLETQALRQVFGDHADRLPVSSTKSAHGHTIGTAGALEAAATLLALNDGFLPPTLHLEQPDPECDLDYVPLVARETDAEVALSNSFAFGGHNVVLALRRGRR